MNKFTSILSSVRGAFTNSADPESVEFLGHVFWRITLSISIIVMFLAICFGMYQLFNVFGALSSNNGSGPAIQPDPLSKLKLQAALTAFDTRTARHELVKTGTTTFPDPTK